MSASRSFSVIETNKLVSVYKDIGATQMTMELFTAMHLSTAPMAASSFPKKSRVSEITSMLTTDYTFRKLGLCSDALCD